ncbi:tRNA preQ1(34) S-adenosylmethionine ribosyltransferase-isomerase QueA [Petroclostridium sp. X23]|uniref:tRNA preQ1(34) S-adenosylmethionine ribosyltransferase-isomerase QueA n=1 Tax=Petroclostridium sp. X23 TaxID=3045146 RepID=UPI0024ACCEC3|nr:tRNA preQ1(34) S-adenosylmethionine ribosyltransferase-isomerase QueA [Petroclostridium sp. X23]WHH59026.1 tRNA preQ1(34) S-adenosylmethionine ribosyltransferase-isomerase QueA [Petroclostridium sp. X23]
MRLKDFYYDLPQELIAQEPLIDRQMSKLMTVDKKTGQIGHDVFRNIIDYLRSGDCLVLNDTRVIPARLSGVKEDTGGKIEFVLLHQTGKNEWEVILKPGRRAKIGSRFVFGNGELKAEIKSIVNDGNRIVQFEYEGIFEQVLDRLGEMPLPHYITKRLEDRERYQTVYSKNKGSAAAPTAGLHFTDELLEKIKQKGVEVVFITLHVGLGTFRPVKVENIQQHKMHSEFYILNEEAAERINACKKENGRIIAVGTTSGRTLETTASQNGEVTAGSGWTDIFIYPGYRFKAVDALITNFHLPESTLLMLVSALAGRENMMEAYETAVKERYRFFSFGDAMFIY